VGGIAGGQTRVLSATLRWCPPGVLYPRGVCGVLLTQSLSGPPGLPGPPWDNSAGDPGGPQRVGAPQGPRSFLPRKLIGLQPGLE